MWCAYSSHSLSYSLIFFFFVGICVYVNYETFTHSFIHVYNKNYSHLLSHCSFFNFFLLTTFNPLFRSAQKSDLRSDIKTSPWPPTTSPLIHHTLVTTTCYVLINTNNLIYSLFLRLQFFAFSEIEATLRDGTQGKPRPVAFGYLFDGDMAS